VDQHVVVEEAVVLQPGDAGRAVGGAVDDVVGLAFGGGTVAAAGELTPRSADVDGFADVPGDVVGVAGVQDQGRAA
jgi:hypothetical protein